VCNASLLCGSLWVLLLFLLDHALYALAVVVCCEPWLDQHGKDLQLMLGSLPSISCQAFAVSIISRSPVLSIQHCFVVATMKDVSACWHVHDHCPSC